MAKELRALRGIEDSKLKCVTAAAGKNAVDGVDAALQDAAHAADLGVLRPANRTLSPWNSKRRTASRSSGQQAEHARRGRRASTPGEGSVSSRCRK